MEYNIKQLRIERGLTQQELSDRVGCSRQYLNEIENTDARNASSQLILAIAKELNTSVDSLFLEIKSDISDN